jgi:GNAT superfamily N-acetyltransferase
MALATWFYEDGIPQLAPLAGMSVNVATDDHLLASITGLSTEEVARRRADGHRPYMAVLDGEPAGYGWVATRAASIGELDLEIQLPAGHRYLSDFGTLPAFRGRGVYPRLLAEILRRECPPATRMWIIFASENLPSGLGIRRAGFQPVAGLSFGPDGMAALSPLGDPERVQEARHLMGLPLVSQDLDPCWSCGGCSCEPSDDGCCCAIAPQPSLERRSTT